MSNRQKLAEAAMAVSEALAAEVLDFLEFAKMREAERKRQAFEEWAATCPEDDEPISPELAARLDDAMAEAARGETVTLEELMASDALDG